MSLSALTSPLGLLLAFAALSVLIIIHEGGHYLVAKWSGMRVHRFQIFFGHPLVEWVRGETTYAVGYIPFGGFVQIAGLDPNEPPPPTKVIEKDGQFVATEGGPDDPRLYGNRPVHQRFLTIFAGPATNYIFAALTMMFVFTVFGQRTPVPGPPLVMDVVKDSPADKAGLRPDDKVLSVAGKKVNDTNEVSSLVGEAKETPIEVVFQRDGEERRVNVTPKKDGESYRIGVHIGRASEWKRGGSVGEALWDGIRAPYDLSRAQLAAIGDIITRKQKADFQGPVGIVSYMKKQILKGTADGLEIVAIISTLLGLFNLLPLPALDGGRLVFILFEAVARRKFPQRVEQSIHMVGMLALLSFLLYVTVFKDVPRHFLGR